VSFDAATTVRKATRDLLEATKSLVGNVTTPPTDAPTPEAQPDQPLVAAVTAPPASAAARSQQTAHVRALLLKLVEATD
jgi:hypothetical protein